MAQVIVVCGAQCVGKTTLAEGVARALRIPLISRDPLMQTLLSAGIPGGGTEQIRDVGVIGVALQARLLESQLALGVSVVLECVAYPPIRDWWRRLAEEHGTRFTAVRCVCSDETLHRARFQARQRERSGTTHPAADMTWEKVRATAQTFARDEDAEITVDAVDPPGANVAAVLRHCGPAV